MARASAGLTPAWAWAAEKCSAGSNATPPTKPLRVTVFMTMNLPFRYSVPDWPLRLVGGLHDRRWLPCTLTRGQDRRRRCPRPIQTHHQVHFAVRRRQPVGFLVGAG